MIQSKDDVFAILVKLVVYGWLLVQILWLLGIPVFIAISVKQYRDGNQEWKDSAKLACAFAGVAVIVWFWGWYSALPDHPLPR